MERTEQPQSPLTARELSRTGRELFADLPFITRTLQTYRPYICPFGALVELVPSSSRVLDIGCGQVRSLPCLPDTKASRKRLASITMLIP